jgi:membrane protein DedA with SNARE-associated domain
LLDWIQTLLSQYGYLVVFTALLVNNAGVPFPGSTVLLTAGFLSEKGLLSPWVTILVGTLGCFLGTSAGYWLGNRYGLKLLKKAHWLRMTHQRIQHMELFFKRYGPKGVFFARFVSVLHPLIGLMAGTGKTPRIPFLLYNLAGSTAYVLLYTFAGYWFGTEWGLHNIWLIHFTSYITILVAALILFLLFWRYKIHNFLGFVYFRKK